MGWGIAHNLLLWQLYQYYGNVELIRNGYPFAKRYVALLEHSAKGDILDQDISDHERLVAKPVELTATAYYYLNVELTEKMANLLHRPEEAASYHRLAARIYRSFQKRFRVAGTGKYDSGTQACQAFVLALGLDPKDAPKAALEVLVEDIHRHGDHLTTGIFGTKYMLNVLSENGYSDLAYKIVSQKSFPGWGYMLDKGATTLREHWEGSDDTFSQNHPMFDSVDEWLTKAVGGISPAPDAVGFDHVLIRPQVVGDLKSASAHYESVHGNIVLEWKVNGTHLEMHVSIPVGCSAEVTIPAGWKGQRSNFHVASGSYVFEADKR